MGIISRRWRHVVGNICADIGRWSIGGNHNRVSVVVVVVALVVVVVVVVCIIFLFSFTTARTKSLLHDDDDDQLVGGVAGPATSELHLNAVAEAAGFPTSDAAAFKEAAATDSFLTFATVVVVVNWVMSVICGRNTQG